MVCGASETSTCLHLAMVAHYQNGDSTGLGKYSKEAVARVWKA